MIDGQEAGNEYDETGLALFSPDGKHVAYAAKKGAKAVVVLDGREGPEFDQIGVSYVLFSPDGAHTGYTAQSGGKWMAVVDGKAGRCL